MGHETNIASIQTLEMQIEEGKGDMIKLKRARNSLLNVFVYIPPETLGRIFVWSLAQKVCHAAHGRDFGGLRKGSYNFLLVCHHWFEVASRTPELWGFWGNTLQDWKKRHHRSRATPLDLVLYGDTSDSGVLFDESLQDAVRSRVIQGNIRQVHLMSRDCGTLTSIISSLTPNDEDGRNGNIESIVLESRGFASVDVSNFFARSRLSRLCFLDLSGGIQISSWDRLAPRTTLLTTLSLTIHTSPPSPTITAPQLFSILVKNPNLQELNLSDVALPDITDQSTFKVPLHNLKILSLTGEFRRIFGLLHRLILPETLDRVDLAGGRCTAEDVSQTLVPYMRDHFRRDSRFHEILDVTLSSFPDSISISATIECDETDPQGLPYAAFNVHSLPDEFTPEVREQLFTDIFAAIPLEHVLIFRADLDLRLPEELFFMMPNIVVFHLFGVELYEGFLLPNPDGPYADMYLLPALEMLCLIDVFPTDEDWSPLTTYLEDQTSDGQTISLEIAGEIPHMAPEVVKEIKDMVKEFVCQYDPRTEDW